MSRCITELTEQEWEEIKSTKTWGWLMSNYRPPIWCDLPHSLEGAMGCWSLTLWPHKMTHAYCAQCDCNSLGGYDSLRHMRLSQVWYAEAIKSFAEKDLLSASNL